MLLTRNTDRHFVQGHICHRRLFHSRIYASNEYVCPWVQDPKWVRGRGYKPHSLIVLLILCCVILFTLSAIFWKALLYILVTWYCLLCRSNVCRHVVLVCLSFCVTVCLSLAISISLTIYNLISYTISVIIGNKQAGIWPWYIDLHIQEVTCCWCFISQPHFQFLFCNLPFHSYYSECTACKVNTQLLKS